MNPERWQQIEKLFYLALDRPPDERGAFLDRGCAGDDSLRQQVEELLSAHAECGSFIESPAWESEAQSVAEDLNSATLGQTIGRYQILSLLAVGGMGEVYLAEDSSLGRKIALKFLPGAFTQDLERVRRFQQEARAASALNHPNIVTIHEIGQVDDRHFIATEFIDGLTLRQYLNEAESAAAENGVRAASRQLKLDEILDISIQAADALAAAHEAGVVHRDIKPENIMIRRRDNYVKVLDFGLAKLTEQAAATVDTEAPTRNRIQTSVGLVMGTPNYMSPEQARGEKVDPRTDIWSLGVVLYEMLAGKAPFARRTPSEVIARILEREPDPLSNVAHEVPGALERIINKTLTKEKGRRYQTAKDLLGDLRLVRQRLGSESDIERTALQHGQLSTRYPTVLDTDRKATATDPGMLVRTIGQHKRSFLLLGLLILVVVATGYGLYRLTSQRRAPVVSFHNANWKRLTTSGKVTRATISPDGKYVVHVMDDGGQQSLRLSQVASSSDKEIMPPAAVTYHQLSFTPDGNYIYYVLESRDLPKPTLFRISTLGGDPKRVPVRLEGDWTDLVLRSGVSFSPDGQRFVFRRIDANSETAIVIANADGSGEQKLVTHRPPEICGHPAWSADGKTIAYVLGDFNRNDVTVYLANVADGTTKALTSQRWFRVGRMAWLADGSGLLMLASVGKAAPSFQIWYLPGHGRQARNLSNDLDNYADLSLTADSSAVLSIKSGQQGNIWISPAGDLTQARQITSGVDRTEGGQGLSWAPDGRIVYGSVTGDGRDIWVIDADGRNQKRLTSGTGINNNPSVSPDGRYIFFLSDRTGVPHIWRMNVDGEDQQQLTNGPGEQLPICSPDGRWIIYRQVFGELTTWRVPTGGGEPMKIIDEPSTPLVTISPDNKLIAYLGDENGRPRVKIIPFDGGATQRTFEVPSTILNVGLIRWTPDGRFLTYSGSRDGVFNLWAQPVQGGAPKQLTDFKSDFIFSYDWSREGKELAISRGGTTSDVVLISNFISKQ